MAKFVGGYAALRLSITAVALARGSASDCCRSARNHQVAGRAPATECDASSFTCPAPLPRPWHEEDLLAGESLLQTHRAGASALSTDQFDAAAVGGAAKLGAFEAARQGVLAAAKQVSLQAASTRLFQAIGARIHTSNQQTSAARSRLATYVDHMKATAESLLWMNMDMRINNESVEKLRDMEHQVNSIIVDDCISDQKALQVHLDDVAHVLDTCLATVETLSGRVAAAYDEMLHAQREHRACTNHSADARDVHVVCGSLLEWLREAAECPASLGNGTGAGWMPNHTTLVPMRHVLKTIRTMPNASSAPEEWEGYLSEYHHYYSYLMVQYHVHRDACLMRLAAGNCSGNATDAEDCRPLQITYELKFCKWRELLLLEASHRGCGPERQALIQANQQANLTTASVLLEYESLERINCHIDALLLNDTSHTNQAAAVERCIHFKVNTTPVEIDYPDVPAAAEVPDTSGTSPCPGEDAWHGHAYHGYTGEVYDTGITCGLAHNTTNSSHALTPAAPAPAPALLSPAAPRPTPAPAPARRPTKSEVPAAATQRPAPAARPTPSRRAGQAARPKAAQAAQTAALVASSPQPTPAPTTQWPTQAHVSPPEGHLLDFAWQPGFAEGHDRRMSAFNRTSGQLHLVVDGPGRATACHDFLMADSVDAVLGGSFRVAAASAAARDDGDSVEELEDLHLDQHSAGVLLFGTPRAFVKSGGAATGAGFDYVYNVTPASFPPTRTLRFCSSQSPEARERADLVVSEIQLSLRAAPSTTSANATVIEAIKLI